ncbi:MULTISPECIES: alpha/beta fold hydrolase [Actinoalloteichus]|uniref:Hydrolase or acyltransferase of alpha/beta superfamily n=1 Tax=Actinoalloteichus fjordicus TaxID=1612552 RepID=A0AAC9LGD8_9PSEU|nr:MULTISPECIES: alpha/beta fold hydrolase [Actinoalloteichus]APU16389.1 putative hydrolase or acyltransferase of alpha/beta superfamily [Actinoalloteichus fjordicus]APU22447.1 putative hydrolase or acyltransferase of alpha/beta superfamily [Actinoalloteichus sp. GBA129-24]
MAVAVLSGLRCNLELLSPAEPRPEQPAVVCVHGMGVDSLASYYLTIGSPLVRAGAEVAMYDLRGHGNSERPPTGYRLDDFGADLAAVIAHLGWQNRPVQLVGNSFGGTVVFHYATAHPRRVVSVTAVETEPPTESWSGWMARVLHDMATEMTAPDAVERLGAGRGRVGLRQAEAMRALVRDTTLVADVPAGPLLSERELADFPIPVLGLYGARSEIADRAQLLPRLLSDCVTVTFPDHGHRLLVDARRAVTDLVVPWIMAGRRPSVVADGAVVLRSGSPTPSTVRSTVPAEPRR